MEAKPCPDCGKAVKNLTMHRPYCKAESLEEKPVKAEVGKGKLQPGTKVDVGKPTAHKIGYSWQWARENLEWGEIIPEDTIPVTWNGLTYIFSAGVLAKAPKHHIGIYQEYRARLRRPPGGVSSEPREGVVSLLGVGPLRPEEEEQ